MASEFINMFFSKKIYHFGQRIESRSFYIIKIISLYYCLLAQNFVCIIWNICNAQDVRFSGRAPLPHPPFNRHVT